MDAWADVQGVDQKAGFIKMMGDPSGSLTRALGMVLNHPGPMSKLGYERCKRFALYIVDGTVKIERVAEAEDDPAGDDFPEDTCAPAMLGVVKGLKDEL